MRRNVFMLIFFILSLLFVPDFVEASQGKLIPITMGDIERNKTFTPKERREFIVEYYLKNKRNGATDEQIINEILKLFEFKKENLEKIKKIALLGKRYKTFEDMIQDTVDKINLSILEKYPGRTDMLIDVDDSSTWKNVKNLYVGKTKVSDFFKAFQDRLYLSNIVASESAQAFLISCADMAEKNEIAMSFVLTPEDGVVLSTQEEGKPVNGIQVDFSGSENLTIGSILFPMEKGFFWNGSKFFGYDNKIYLPFKTKLENLEKNGTVRAKLTITPCREGVCKKEVLSEIMYTTDKSTLESPLCQEISHEYISMPKSQKSGIKLEKAFFKKGKSGEVDLISVFQMPLLRATEVFFLVKNEQGLKFSDPFLIQKDRNFLAKMRLINPEKFQGQADLTFDIGYLEGASEFNIKAQTEEEIIQRNLSFFSFSILKFGSAFVLGIKFFVLTPVLIAFFLFINQLMVVPRRTLEKGVAFSDGLSKSFICFSSVLWIALCLGGLFPIGDMSWGKQFNSPFLNFIFMNIFLLAAFNWKKLFDDVAVEIISKPFEPLFSVLQINYVREKAGAIAGFAIGILLFITPMTYLYYQTYDLLSQSFLFYSLAFIAGVLAPFVFLIFFDEKMLEIEEEENTHRAINLIIFLTFCFQIAALLLSIGSEAGINVLLGAAVLLCLSGIFIWKTKRFLKSGVVCAILIGASFIPFSPTDKDLNNLFSVDFDEELLQRQVAEGKNVYLNVSESFCLSCLWNRFVMARETDHQIKSGDLIVMRINYDNPFLQRLLFERKLRTLPMNIVFSPKYPEGKMIDTYIKMSSVPKIVQDSFVFKQNEPILQTQPEETEPKSEEKGTD